MASTDPLELYPRGQIAFGAGELQEAASGRFSTTVNAKLKHTLRRSPSGAVKGNTEVSGQLEINVGENGLEADWYGKLLRFERVAFRFKQVTDVYRIDGWLTSIDNDTPLDDAMKLTVNFIGRLAE